MRFADFTPFDLVLLAQGLGVSLALFLTTTVAGLLLGLGFAVVHHFRFPFVNPLIVAVTEALKNSPVLVQLFLVFFGIPALMQIRMTPASAAFITLSLNTAAFAFVIIRAGIESIDRDQIDAAEAFGLRRIQILRRVIGPQALAFSIGPIVGILVNQLQVTSLISVIGVFDLTKIGNILNLRTLEPFIVWAVIGSIYYVCAKILAHSGARLERRIRRSYAWGEV
ncbi:Cystine ABC transporter, permease protein [Candidatus Rhodobacter oscarellae]|uniref:Cystine ABC transporter, permease protein n=1 Tax=Candidatus Rhodobacter oscarellae TaxID=1675527 RepID=A0A0J9EFM8_9RHOB|nr:amino acid ABC transporter permease [Candidatus Rhodobacter lobularis]KMW60484.1 Cystine ABC transporter, permease protein [Candidatus Rhodobacter lobularis]